VREGDKVHLGGYIDIVPDPKAAAAVEVAPAIYGRMVADDGFPSRDEAPHMYGGPPSDRDPECRPEVKVPDPVTRDVCHDRIIEVKKARSEKFIDSDHLIREQDKNVMKLLQICMFRN